MPNTPSNRLPCRTDDLYAFIHARSLIWIGDGLGLPRSFCAGAGRLLATAIKDVALGKVVVIDCEGVYQIANHALSEPRKQLHETSGFLIILNANDCSEDLRKEFHGLECQTINNKSVADVLIFTGSRGRKEFTIEDIQRRFSHAFQSALEQVVRECYRPFKDNGDPEPEKLNSYGERRLQSTPLLAKGVYNARAIASDPSNFVLVSVMLASSVYQMIEKHGDESEWSLLSVSLRSSPFAAAVGSLLSIPVEIVDHMGPRMKILEEYTFDPLVSEGLNYFYIGDFCVGGSELRIAETYSLVKGAELSSAIVIGSVLDYASLPETIPFHRLVDLHKLNPENNYRLIE